MPLLNGSLVVYISIHAPREGGDAFSPLYVPQRYISIHAPREGGDSVAEESRLSQILISIHAPREGGDFNFCSIDFRNIAISIHAPREGGDALLALRSLGPDDFNPRPPRGGRLSRQYRCTISWIFQSTPPARGATISLGNSPVSSLFQSTPPARGATPQYGWTLTEPSISIHAPREGGDLLPALRRSA